jgi:proline iminopeptidase
MPRIAHIPAVLVHGRLDVSSPLATAYDLHKAWPASELIVVEGEGHGGSRKWEEVTRAVLRLEP